MTADHAFKPVLDAERRQIKRIRGVKLQIVFRSDLYTFALCKPVAKSEIHGYHLDEQDKGQPPKSLLRSGSETPATPSMGPWPTFPSESLLKKASPPIHLRTRLSLVLCPPKAIKRLKSQSHRSGSSLVMFTGLATVS